MAPKGYRDRSFGVLSGRQTRDPEIGRFLLNPARIGDVESCVLLEIQELEISERLQQAQGAVAAAESAVVSQALSGPGVDREQHRQISRSVATMAARSSGLSTVDGRCNVISA